MSRRPLWTADELRARDRRQRWPPSVRRFRRLHRLPHASRPATSSWRCAMRATATTSSADALARGAACAMVDRDPPGVAADAPLLRVADTLRGLTALGAAGRARFGGRVVAVTGSVGKTGTKEMLRLLLGALGETHAAVASYNNHWGVPLTLARCPRGAAFAVVEIGMNNPGEIAPLVAPRAAACRGGHDGRRGAYRPSRRHGRDRGREGGDRRGPGAGRRGRAAGRLAPSRRAAPRGGARRPRADLRRGRRRAR